MGLLLHVAIRRQIKKFYAILSYSNNTLEKSGQRSGVFIATTF